MPTAMLTVGIAVALRAELAGAAADLTGAATDLAGARSLNSMTLNWNSTQLRIAVINPQPS
jgi:hypothetical protein